MSTSDVILQKKIKLSYRNCYFDNEYEKYNGGNSV